jgi:hypothetical protein
MGIAKAFFEFTIIFHNRKLSVHPAVNLGFLDPTTADKD